MTSCKKKSPQWRGAQIGLCTRRGSMMATGEGSNSRIGNGRGRRRLVARLRAGVGDFARGFFICRHLTVSFLAQRRMSGLAVALRTFPAYLAPLRVTQRESAGGQ